MLKVNSSFDPYNDETMNYNVESQIIMLYHYHNVASHRQPRIPSFLQHLKRPAVHVITSILPKFPCFLLFFWGNVGMLDSPTFCQHSPTFYCFSSFGFTFSIVFHHFSSFSIVFRADGRPLVDSLRRQRDPADCLPRGIRAGFTHLLREQKCSFINK